MKMLGRWRNSPPRDSIRHMKALDELCKATGTRPDEREFLDGPDSRCVDYWLKHKPSGKEAYVNDDQGSVTVDCEIVL
jgi:hypothetical protein